MPVTIATWNVNSVRSRLQHLLGWLREEKPDIVLLQELKCLEEQFPAMEVEELGYNLAIYGEKSYNGVAILSKFPLTDITRGLAGDESDTQARYIEAVVEGPVVMRVASVYVVNGQTVDSDKFQFKQRFLTRLEAHMRSLLRHEEVLVIGGDYNIAPEDSDVHNPKLWEDSVLTHDIVRTHFRRMLHMGLYDAACLTKSQAYTWWDYRAGALEADNGLRIDHLLLSPQAADRLKSCHVAKHVRELEKASDHAPVIISLD